MSDLPPLLDSPLPRVLRVSRFNGLCVVILAGIGTAASFPAGDRIGAGIGLLAVAAGLMELHGRSLVAHGEAGGFGWLSNSQLFLMLVVIAYAIARIELFDAQAMLQILPDETLDALKQMDMDQHAFIRQVNTVLYVAVIAVTIVYQGAMWRFYRRAGALLANEMDEASE